MRVVWMIAALATAGWLTGCGAHPGAGGTTRSGVSASCAAPQLAARPFRQSVPTGRVAVRQGERLTVYGRFYTHDCFDSGPSVGAPDRPVPRVELDLVAARGSTTLVGIAHPAGPATAFVTTVRIPASTPPGPARIVGRHLGGTLLLRVRRAGN